MNVLGKRAFLNPSLFSIRPHKNLHRTRYNPSLLYSTTRNDDDTLKKMHQDALQISKAGIRAVDPHTAIQSHVSTNIREKTLTVSDTQNTTRVYNLGDYQDVIILGFGKAASAMTASILQSLLSVTDAERIRGAVIIKDEHTTHEENSLLNSCNVEIYPASHPIPDERSASAAHTLLELASQYASPSTLFLCCISGGGSSLFCAPTPPLTLGELSSTNSILLKSGMDILQINTVRKILEKGKGGKLAEVCRPGRLITLVLSDVIGDDLSYIASGPTVPSSTGFQEVRDLIQEYRLENELPVKVLQVIQNGVDETKEKFDHADTFLVGNNFAAVAAAADQAKDLGYHPIILTTELQGEAKVVGPTLIQFASYIKHHPETYPMTPLPACILAGGETTVTLPSNNRGKGGRNQELGLASALSLDSQNLNDMVLMSIGTDGTDGPTDAAGVCVDRRTVEGVEREAERALKEHDAYTFFEGMGGDVLVKTGPTGTNVADIYIVLVR